MRQFGRVVTLAVIAVLGLSLTARTDEEDIPVDKLPKPVLNAFKAKFPEAKISGASKEDEDGKTVYEIESTQNGLGLDALLKPNGDFVEIEKELKPADLPAAVSTTIKTKYPKDKVKKAEEVTKGEKVTYEVVVENSEGKKTEVTLDKDGKILGTE